MFILQGRYRSPSEVKAHKRHLVKKNQKSIGGAAVRIAKAKVHIKLFKKNTFS